MSDNSLVNLRTQIDDIDRQLVDLLNERARLAIEIGQVKTSGGRVAYDPVRERTVLDKVNALNKGPLPKGSIEDIYASVMTACREIQTTSSGYTDELGLSR